tara:strand:- start:1235 stop:2125 length:891 start_codon:yes stop_codon:yes gene_type:complete
MRAFTIDRESPLIVAYFVRRWHQIIGFYLTVSTAYLFTLPTYAADTKVLPLDCTKDIVAAEINALPYRVTHSYPHRTSAFSQGLVYQDGNIYESTGGYGQSSIAEIQLKDGRLIQQQSIDETLFGEGLTIWQDQLIQLTWHSRKVLRYHKKDFSPLPHQSIKTEGWGLTHDGHHLINSDGSATLYYRDPESLMLVKSLRVTYLNRPLKRLNELEWVDQCLLANIWQSPRIAVIKPSNGQVLGFIDLSPILKREQRQPSAGVANGIAVMPGEQSLLITGKNWQRIYQLQFQATQKPL